MNSLYELKNQRYEIAQHFGEEEILPQVIVDTLDSIDEIMEQKVENIAYIIKNLSAQAEIIKAEKNRLAEKESAIKKRIEFLRDYAKSGMEASNIKKIECDLFNISLRSSKVVKIAEGTKLPDMYVTYKDPLPNKKALKEAINNGEVIVGVSIQENSSLQIR